MASCAPIRWRQGGKAAPATSQVATATPHLFSREFFLQFTGELVHIRCLTKRLNRLRGGVYVDANMLAELL